MHSPFSIKQWKVEVEHSYFGDEQLTSQLRISEISSEIISHKSISLTSSLKIIIHQSWISVATLLSKLIKTHKERNY